MLTAGNIRERIVMTAGHIGERDDYSRDQVKSVLEKGAGSNLTGKGGDVKGGQKQKRCIIFPLF